jgi:hypothetical protein
MIAHFSVRQALPFMLKFTCMIGAATLFSLAARASTVSIQQSGDGQFTLLRNGRPYFIRGAGGCQHLALLASLGGNSIRTWGIDQLDTKVDGKPILDRLQDLGLTITLGIWIGHEAQGFNYSDPAQVQAQRDYVRAVVRQYKDSPALLIWGLGNEMEGPASDGNPRLWKELNVLAAIVKQEDPNHPVMSVIAGAAPAKVRGILSYYPNLDILGVNAYSGAPGVGDALKALHWNKPFILTEFGPRGAWEAPATPWHAPIEPSSRDKAAAYYTTETGVIRDGKDICLGSYAFLWGQKQETTSTWYGMFLETGEKLPAVDAIARAWSGKWPPTRSPLIVSLNTPLREATVAPGQTVTASVLEHFK